MRVEVPSRTPRFTPAPVIFGAACLIALAVGAQLGAWRNVPVTAAGVAALALAIGAAQFPLLGLVGVTIVTVGNLADVLIRFWGMPSITPLLIPGLAFILGYRWLLRSERPFVHGGALAAIAVFVLMSFASLLHAHEYGIALDESIEITKNMIVVIFALSFFHYRNSVNAFVDAIVAFSLLAGMFAVYKYGISGDMANEFGGLARTPHYGGDRLAGFLGDPNEYGAVLVLILPLAVYRALWSRSVAGRLLGLAAVAVILPSVMLTQSRGALVALVFGAALYGLTLERSLAIRYYAAAGVVATVALALLSDEVVARFSTIFDVAETGAATDAAVAGRLGAWAVAVQLFHDHPFLGVGAGNFNALYQTTAIDLGIIFGGRDLSPHGLYLQVLSEHGVVGLAIFLGIIGFAARGVLRAMAILRARGDRRTQAMCAALGIALASHLAAMIFLHGPGARLLWIFLTVAIALPAIVRNRIEAVGRGVSPSSGGLPL